MQPLAMPPHVLEKGDQAIVVTFAHRRLSGIMVTGMVLVEHVFQENCGEMCSRASCLRLASLWELYGACGCASIAGKTPSVVKRGVVLFNSGTVNRYRC